MSPKPIKILLAEDMAINQKIVSMSLKRLGYEVDIANDGIEAIEKYRNNHFDLILMDIQMPNMDGFEATSKIREIEVNENLKRSFIVALTANAVLHDKEKCFKSGMDHYITKPFKPHELEEILNMVSL